MHFDQLRMLHAKCLLGFLFPAVRQTPLGFEEDRDNRSVAAPITFYEAAQFFGALLIA